MDKSVSIPKGDQGKCDGYMNFILALHTNINLAIANGSITIGAVNSCVQRAQFRAMMMDTNHTAVAIQQFKRITV